MGDPSETERLERAKRLRAKIDELDNNKAPSATPKNESPSEFVHRRMAEIDEERKKLPD